jgi:hypothetical protein
MYFIFILEKTMLTKVLYLLVGCIFHAFKCAMGCSNHIISVVLDVLFSCTRKQVELEVFSYALDVVTQQRYIRRIFFCYGYT